MMKELTAEFVEDRIAVWEAEHGMISDEGRECLKALLWGCLNMQSSQTARVAEQAKLEKNDPDACSRRCFCKRKKH